MPTSATNESRRRGPCPEDEELVLAAIRAIEEGKALETVSDLVAQSRRAKQLHARQRDVAKAQTAILEDLLDSEAVLCKVHGLSFRDDGTATVTVRAAGELRELRVHPHVEVDELKALGPMDYVRVSKEKIVIGTLMTDGDASAVVRQQGAIGEFRSFHDRDAGSVVVTREGQGSEVVMLAPWLREAAFVPGMQVVLHRDETSWVIDAITEDHASSRFEIPVDGLRTSLSDLAGLESLAGKLVEDILLRAAFPELRKEFALRALGGVLLTSRKPGMGKTTLVRALVHDLSVFGRESGFEVALFHMKPNALKSVWHGGDAKNVRELFESVRARCRAATGRLLCFVVFDEVDCLGSRADNGTLVSSAQNDVVQSMLAEMDGLEKDVHDHADVVYIGMTTREELVDSQLRRPGRFGGVVRAIPDYTAEAAEEIILLNLHATSIPWRLNGEITTAVDEQTLRERVVRPALARVFDTVVMRYSTERQRQIPVTSGQLMAAVHFENAVTKAKEHAAARKLHADGIPAVTREDLVDALFDESLAQARQLASDPGTLRRFLDVQIPVNAIDPIPVEEVREDRYLADD